MELISSILTAVLFVAFLPGVMVTLPSKSSPRSHIILVHAILFTVVTGLVMRYYWVNIKGYLESFGNFGPVCPNGYAPNKDPSGIDREECIPVGHATYSAGTGKVPDPSLSSP
jgi:hypothetical protein